MSEKLNLLAETAASIALMNILCTNGHEEFLTYLNKTEKGHPDSNVEVELKVNGKTVSWEKAMAEMMEIRKIEVDRRVAKKLDDIANLEGIRLMLHDIDRVKYTLRDKIESFVGEKIDWSEE